ncbi:hypothetical protein PybrP1_001768 [[Pythium] brassicae (nom. inval.)]|nr:hypothetical protein PybrP1_001768 [[Pythium] brassicae (nom. inval.)]
MGKKATATPATEEAPNALAAAPAAPSSNPLAAMFAQSSVLFAKKASYVQADVPASAKVNVKAIRAAAAAQVAAGDATSSKRKRAAAKDAAAAVAGEQRDADETDAEEAEQPTKKPKKKKHKQIAKEAAEAAALAAGGALPAPEEPSVDADAAAREAKSRRTVFVGNVSLDATAKDLKALFAPCGKVEAVRLRFLPLAGCAVDQAGNQKLVMKVCANKKLLTDAKDHCNAYVTFADEASVAAALALNGAPLLHRPVRVDHETPVVDPRRSVFLGNVGFHVPDEKVRRFFEQRLASDEEPQPVVNVRLIRDRATGVGKGFGYVLLRSAALAGQALALHESKLEGRELRVQVCGKRFKSRKSEAEDRPAAAAKPHEGVRASAGAQARLAAKRKASGGRAAETTKTTGAPLGKKTKTAVGASKKPTAPKYEVRRALHTKTKTAPGANAKASFKKPATAKAAGSRKTSGRAPEPKGKKPKHAARKARQAAEAAAAAAGK